MGEVVKTFCPRCGSEMEVKARCCLKCGYLNPEHPDNKNMNKYTKGIMESYSVGSGKTIGQKQADKIVDFTVVGNNTGSKRVCFLVNLIVYLLFVVVTTTYIFLKTGCITGIIGSKLYIYLLGASIWIFVFYSMELVYMKMNKRWWSSLIPVYNMMELSDAVLKSSLLGLIVFIPVVGQIFLLYILFKLGVGFKKNGFLTMLFPYVMLPIIGFGSSGFEGHNYVDEEKHAREKDYKRSKVFLITVSIVFILSMAMFVYNNFAFFEKQHKSLSRSYYVEIAKKMVNETDKKFKNNRYSCDEDKISSEYVFYFPDVGDKFNIPFSLYNDVISGYVIIQVDSNENYTYLVSLTDEQRGIPEVNFKDLDVDDVTDFKELDNKYQYGLSCVIK